MNLARRKEDYELRNKKIIALTDEQKQKKISLWLQKKMLIPWGICYWWEAKLTYKFLGPPAFCFSETQEYLGNAEKRGIFSLSVHEEDSVSC